MLKIKFNVEYGFKTNLSQEDAVKMICKQLHISPMQIKNMEFYHMHDFEIESEDRMERRNEKNELCKL